MVKSDNSSPNSSSDNQQTSEPKYTGVRKRKWGKWVSEIRLPNSRERIWLGSYDTPEKAARAFDAALYCLRGPGAKFNFPESPPDIDGGELLSPQEIQAIAAKFANETTSSNSATNNTNPDASPGKSIPESSLQEMNQHGSTSDNNGASEVHSVNDHTGNDWPFFNGMDLDYGVTDFGYYQDFECTGTEFYPSPPSVFYDSNADHEATYSQPSFLWDF